MTAPPDVPAYALTATRVRWRTGRKVGRTIYAQLGVSPGDDDTLIGVMDTPALATIAVEAVNRQLDTPPRRNG